MFYELFSKGEFLSAIIPKEAPFSPTPLPPESESDKMAYIWLTDYVVNTAGLVYQEAGILNKTVTPSMVSSESKRILHYGSCMQLLTLRYIFKEIRTLTAVHRWWVCLISVVKWYQGKINSECVTFGKVINIMYMTQFEICDVSKLELTENSNFIKIVLKPKKIIHCNC